MRSVADLVQAVIAEGRFDVQEPQALAWLSSRHEQMCLRGRCYRRKVGIGPSVKAQANYSLPPDIMEIREVQLQSAAATGQTAAVPLGPGRHIDLAEGALGYIWLGGLYMSVGGGLWVRDESGEGEDQLALYPAPSESGLPITVYAVCRPEPLLTSASGALQVGMTGLFRYASTTRALTAAEMATFLAGGGLPGGVGTEAGVSSTVYEYQAAGQPWATSSVIKDGTGAYHSSVPLTMQGAFLWRAKGLDAGGKSVWETPIQHETVVGSSGLKIPSEFYDELVDGAIAMGLRRIEGREELAQPFQARYEAACAELAAQQSRRTRGSGPVRIRVAGYTA